MSLVEDDLVLMGASRLRAKARPSVTITAEAPPVGDLPPPSFSPFSITLQQLHTLQRPDRGGEALRADMKGVISQSQGGKGDGEGSLA